MFTLSPSVTSASVAPLLAAQIALDQARERFSTVKQQCSTVTIDFARKCINPYELIGYAQSTPRQRNFYAFLELITHVPSLRALVAGRTLHIGEAPGNFIDALLHLQPQADWHAISLNPGVPFYEHLQQAKKTNGHSRVMYGPDGSGNVMKPELLSFVERELGSERATLITCDAGLWIDDKDRNQQEVLNVDLLAAELRLAMTCIAVHGSIVIKVFDTFHVSTHNLLRHVASYFAATHVIKLNSGRITSSERYVVLVDYQGQPYNTQIVAYSDHWVPLMQSTVQLAQQQTLAINETVQLATYLNAINMCTPTDARTLFTETLAVCHNRLQLAQEFLTRVECLK
jgi:hypothetical protein